MIKILLFLIFQGFTLKENPPEVIVPYQHANQLILLFAPNNRAPEYEQMLIEFSKDPIGLDRRDMVIFEIFQFGGIKPDGTSLSEDEAQILRNYFNVGNGIFSVLILGKNLQEKYRAAQPVTTKEIFGEID
jgi:hypothetical protein